FFFQAGDGIRDFHVTGVQTCALPIYNTGIKTSGIPAISRESVNIQLTTSNNNTTPAITLRWRPRIGWHLNIRTIEQTKTHTLNLPILAKPRDIAEAVKQTLPLVEEPS